MTRRFLSSAVRVWRSHVRPRILIVAMSPTVVLYSVTLCLCFFFSSRRRHTRLQGDWSSDVCSSDLIRNRGTLGGSIALADPAAEYPACLVALDAAIVVQGKDGERIIRAEKFFKGLFEVDLRPGEIVTAAEIPAILKSERSVFLELARRHGDYAIVGLAAHKGSESRFVFLGAGATPVFARHASSAGSAKDSLALLKKDLDPPADLYNTSATKLHLAGVLLERAWTQLTTSH